MDRETYNNRLFNLLICALSVVFGISLWATVNGQISGDKPANECAEYAQWWIDQCIPYWKWIALKTLTDPIAIFTGLLTIFTFGLLTVTYKLWSAGLDQIKLAREEFVATHRPRVIVRFILGPIIGNDGLQYVRLTLANVGESPATITKIDATLEPITKMGVLNPKKIIKKPTKIEPIVLESGQRHVLTVTELFRTKRLKNVLSDRQLFCVGRIVYVDESGIERETAFNRTHQPLLSRFVPSDNPEQEYVD